MFSKCLKDCRFICFTCGAVAAVVGGKILKSDKARKICVKGMAAGMKLKHDAEVSFQNMKEEAQDICYDAMKEAENEDEEQA